MVRKKSIVATIKDRLNELDIGESICKLDFFKEIISSYSENELDYFQKRSLDVSLCNAKKLIKDKKFNSRINNLITRIE